MSNVVEENRAYYGALYRKRGRLTHILRARISFDQQSKSRLNWSLLETVLPQLEAATRERSIDLLDYGAGWGSFLFRAPRRRYRLHAYDLVDAAVENIAASMAFLRRDYASVRVDAAGELPPTSFDVIVCSHVLEHVVSDAALTAQLVRALRPGGYLLANVPIHEVVADPKHARAYDDAKLRALLEEAGLTVIETRAADRFTAFLLWHEDGSSNGAWRAALRATRAALALVPLPFVTALETALPAQHRAQQLVAVARKPP